MKPKVLYRILLVLVMLVLFALGLCFIGIALNFITADTVNAIAALPDASAINGWITAGVGLLLRLIAIVLIIGFNRRAPKNQAPASAIISQNEMGISSITLAAIDDMVKRHCATANGNVKKCDSRIAVVENKLKIDLRVVIAEDANIPETTEALRTSLIDYIQTITGIQVSDVSILVSTEPEKKAEA